MVRRFFAIALAALFVLWTQSPAPADEILVSAAASLTNALSEIGAAYQAKSKHTVKFNFGPSSGLARQIEAGAPADIFFSADLQQMDNLDKRGRLEPGTLRNLLSNRLVVIVPVDSRLDVASPKDLLRPGVKRIALAEPSSVPVGVYTREYLTSDGLWERIKPKIVPVLDVRATLAAVEAGNVEAGFVYETDAAISKKVKVAFRVPEQEGRRIVYPAAILRESKKKPAARDFMTFVSGLAARQTFKKYGFAIRE